MKNKLQPCLKLWFSNVEKEGVFGDGKWRLLNAIKQEGSLKAAAKKIGISYRKAWGDLKKAEECLNIKFLERRRGGKSGGETTLTDEGEALLNAYTLFRKDVKEATEKAFKKHIVI